MEGHQMSVIEIEPITVALTINQTIAAMQISRATLYALITSGALISYRVGGRRFVTREAIAAYLANAQGPYLPIKTHSTKKKTS